MAVFFTSVNRFVRNEIIHRKKILQILFVKIMEMFLTGREEAVTLFIVMRLSYLFLVSSNAKVLSHLFF
ncbi:MAG: hypothetical protein A3B74_03240 [Candidatus Kerfeldbacteria bacterium RIFCSPHIGHO2_02_FULL_42_14]|uniref:Uncharacterized protein n=1 Tax=Candidatus Kerfeldbacteria bacterium RIFCSPHIGHO2_02_FULL_42_14 TaxID=1798540 RepID=A0A1G2APE7_9BACT|nr:MAG: hypothetical protein A3B74_03240 [Candidatus Kerfeldbacteria bacterium RIFCSPHIGHO2_02_FULL_42_14]OGY84156.1 MAG: hypothetical protein A3I91_01555 [Candidatus Kerfeldbacteria bacterium RIFCSPLOWO2_02_FULL_42_19]OGY87287.1 MAG: hypothetical protein A3G01_03030 [Candidatus Kerfeldbacteria bacterium RIFCSPLOWO2_12_FULL_43_9]